MVPPIEVFSNSTVLLHRLALNFRDQTVPLAAWSAKGQDTKSISEISFFPCFDRGFTRIFIVFLFRRVSFLFPFNLKSQDKFFLKFRNVKLEPHFLLKYVFHLWRIFCLLISVFLNDKLILQNAVMQWKISQIIADVQEMLW